jgi:hypothetical protein
VLRQLDEGPGRCDVSKSWLVVVTPLDEHDADQRAARRPRELVVDIPRVDLVVSTVVRVGIVDADCRSTAATKSDRAVEGADGEVGWRDRRDFVGDVAVPGEHGSGGERGLAGPAGPRKCDHGTGLFDRCCVQRNVPDCCAGSLEIGDFQLSSGFCAVRHQCLLRDEGAAPRRRLRTQG